MAGFGSACGWRMRSGTERRGRPEASAERWPAGALREAWPAAAGPASLEASRGAETQTCPGGCDCHLETAACCPASTPGDRSGSGRE